MDVGRRAGERFLKGTPQFLPTNWEALSGAMWVPSPDLLRLAGFLMVPLSYALTRPKARQPERYRQPVGRGLRVIITRR